MPLVAQSSNFTSFDELPISYRRRLYRRSSCPSIPRSVSADSSICAIDPSSEDASAPTDFGDVEGFRSPLFRGLGGFGEEHGEAAQRASATSGRGFTPRAKAIDCDDSVSDSLSNYQFDITGHDHLLEPTKVSKGNLLMEQSSTPVYPRSLVVPQKPLNSKASRPLPPPRDSSPSPQHFPPSVPPTTGPIIPLNAGTRPLQIGRSKKRTESSSTSQRTPRADAQHVPPTSKPISRATTHVNLREAYKRGSPLAERKVPTRGVPPIKPSHLHPYHMTPNQNVTQVRPNHHLISALHHVDPFHSTANSDPHTISNRSHSS
jgi:hypothetical protein